MAVSEAFGRALAAERTVLNARVAAARARMPGFDLPRFTAFLEQQADPLIVAIAARQPEAVQRCAITLFEMSIAIIVNGLAGSGSQTPLASRVWSDIAPAIVPLIIDNPVESLGALTNAGAQLAAIDGVRGGEWLQQMIALSPRANTSRDLRILAAVAAWRSGAAHLRSSALQAVGTLPPPLACTACGADGDNWAALAEGYARDSWWRPDDASENGFSVGRFTGFGGRFGQPPKVRACEQGFIVTSGDRNFLLIADAYGATLHTASSGESSARAVQFCGGAIAIVGNQLVTEDRRIPVDLPAEGLALAYNRDTIAVSSPFSYQIHLLPRWAR